MTPLVKHSDRPLLTTKVSQALKHLIRASQDAQYRRFSARLDPDTLRAALSLSSGNPEAMLKRENTTSEVIPPKSAGILKKLANEKLDLRDRISLCQQLADELEIVGY